MQTYQHGLHVCTEYLYSSVNSNNYFIQRREIHNPTTYLSFRSCTYMWRKYTWNEVCRMATWRFHCYPYVPLLKKPELLSTWLTHVRLNLVEEYILFTIKFQHWDDSNWNPSPMKARAYFCFIVNTMLTRELAKEGARPSAILWYWLSLSGIMQY